MQRNDPAETEITPELAQLAGEWAANLRTIAERLGERPNRANAASVVARVADTIETALQLYRADGLGFESSKLLQALIERLAESTWNGKTSRTKNDVLRQASYGTFPPAAESLARSIAADTRERSANRNRTFRRDTPLF